MVLHPSLEKYGGIGIDCYPDADFSSLWKHENLRIPLCSYPYRLCYLHWQLTYHVGQPYPIWDHSVNYVGQIIGAQNHMQGCFPHHQQDCWTWLTTWSSNEWLLSFLRAHPWRQCWSLDLGKTQACQMNPRSKHYAIKYHWFCEHIFPHKIDLCKISSYEKPGDLFIKGLSHQPFKYLWAKLMGWWTPIPFSFL